MFKLLNIRLIQIKRELYATGPLVILVFAFFIYLVAYGYKTYQNKLEALILTVFLCSVCFILQAYRKDKTFIYNHLDHPHLEIYSEYILLTLPFSLSCLLTVNWFYYPSLLAALWFIPYLKYTFKRKPHFKNISRIIPPTMFEWISGFRKTFGYLIPMYLLAIGFCWFRFLPLFILWLINATIASFYSECEPIQILKESALSANQFLKKKLYQHSKYILLLFIPIVIVNTIFNYEYWFIILLFIPIQLALICFAICLKYSNYQPNKILIGSNMTLSLVSIGVIIPYFLPIPLMLSLYYYGKAKKNLLNYFND